MTNGLSDLSTVHRVRHRTQRVHWPVRVLDPAHVGEGVDGVVPQRPEHVDRAAGEPLPPTNTSGSRTGTGAVLVGRGLVRVGLARASAKLICPLCGC
jgi:hypothetical protein